MKQETLLSATKQTRFDENYLRAHASMLLNFASGSFINSGGFGYLDRKGQVEPSKPLELWINCRMTQVFGLATAAGLKDCSSEVQHGIHSILRLFEDKGSFGFFSSVDQAGNPIATAKSGYDHAFVLLAAATGVALRISGASDLFTKIDKVIDDYFWDSKYGLLRNEWNQEFTILDSYQGVNANMHALECFLAVYDVTQDQKYLKRSLSICQKVVNEFARKSNWMLPEHFTENWEIDFDYNLDKPADPFRPYGVTIGHLFEWSRLILQLKFLPVSESEHEWIDEAAKALYVLAKDFGWNVDGEVGFIYTMDWNKKPVVRARMHWVAAEAVMTAYTLWRMTGEDAYLTDYNTWWNYISEYVIDHEYGSWFSELNPSLEVAETTWPGKPDVYHAFNACFLPIYPLNASFIGSFVNN